MKLPINLFLSGVMPNKIYYFSSSQLINTPIPHYFVCLKRTENEVLILACFTSQVAKRQRFIEITNLPKTTLVWVTPSLENGLEKDSYIDCNNVFEYTMVDFRNLYEQDKIAYVGEISDENFEEILIGINDSPLIEENIKELLP